MDGEKYGAAPSNQTAVGPWLPWVPGKLWFHVRFFLIRGHSLGLLGCHRGHFGRSATTRTRTRSFLDCTARSPQAAFPQASPRSFANKPQEVLRRTKIRRMQGATSVHPAGNDARMALTPRSLSGVLFCPKECFFHSECHRSSTRGNATSS